MLTNFGGGAPFMPALTGQPPAPYLDPAAAAMRASRLAQQAQTPVAGPQPQLAPPPDPTALPPPPAPVGSGPPNFLRTLDDVLGGRGTISESIANQAARHQAATQAQARQQQIADIANSIGFKDPREKLLFLMDPGGWAEAQKSRQSFQHVAGGEKYWNAPDNGGGPTSGVAPKVDKVDDRFGVATTNPDGTVTAQYSAPRGATFNETSEAARRQAETDQQAARDAEIARHNKEMERLGGTRADIAQQSVDKRGAKAGAAALPAGFVRVQ